MPQLNPSPWLALMVFSWATFLIFLPYKILKHVMPNVLTPPTQSSNSTITWFWPWA
uniref:ATP synthase complex subunit 8 n=1 Tax=Chrysochir aurea TaxID=3353606 RepID=A0A343K081_CHRAC|nr:ATP synthase F0 subunit 8 [Chrysochir aureus]QOS02900.1 ATP synthase F0 subunit 8 [Chrysochir aureus]